MNLALIVRNKLKRAVNTFHTVPGGEEKRTKGRENYYVRQVKVTKRRKTHFVWYIIAGNLATMKHKLSFTQEKYTA
jgi:hypothetical protein